MISNLEIAFLVCLLITFILFRIRFGSPVEFGDLLQLLTGTFFLVMVLLTTGLFFIIIFNLNPGPGLRQAAYQLSLQQLVSYDNAIPPNLEDNLEVEDVMRIDTDGDDYSEWVVFYKFDKQQANSPIKAFVYDNDRGNPPVIFPYELRPPGRDYLSEFYISLELAPVTVDENGPKDVDLPEIIVQGTKELSIFRFRQNSEIWDFPRDAPPRYETIAFFRGSGGVDFDSSSTKVTVIDRDGFDRSQLAVRSIYAVNPATNTYWDQFYEATDLDRKLAAPVFSTIDFFVVPPDDILNTTFPEKVVLAFYISTCVEHNDSLCRNTTSGWQTEKLLAGDALAEFEHNNPDFFGLSSFSGTQNLAVSHLRYYPNLETDLDLLGTGGGRDVVTGEQAQFDVVDVNFVVDNAPLQTARFQMEFINGQWKISRRLSVDTPLDSPTQIPASPPP